MRKKRRFTFEFVWAYNVVKPETLVDENQFKGMKKPTQKKNKETQTPRPLAGETSLQLD